MKKYYTRACNFYYGNKSRDLVKKKKAFPLNGNKNISGIWLRKELQLLSTKFDIYLRFNQMNQDEKWKRYCELLFHDELLGFWVDISRMDVEMDDYLVHVRMPQLNRVYGH